MNEQTHVTLDRQSRPADYTFGIILIAFQVALLTVAIGLSARKVADAIEAHNCHEERE